MQISNPVQKPWMAAPNHNSLLAKGYIKAGLQDSAQNGDKLSINNPFNRNFKKDTQNHMIESMVEQRQKLVDRRGDFLSNALKKGMDAESIKAGLEEIDQQIKELEKEIAQIQLEEKQKALKQKEENQQDLQESINEQNEEGTDSPSKENDPMSSHTMNAVLAASSEADGFSSVKKAQISLKREAKEWEHCDPERSNMLRRKAQRLDGKAIEMAEDINSDIKKAVEMDTSLNKIKINKNDTAFENTEPIINQAERKAVAGDNSGKLTTDAENETNEASATKASQQGIQAYRDVVRGKTALKRIGVDTAI